MYQSSCQVLYDVAHLSTLEQQVIAEVVTLMVLGSFLPSAWSRVACLKFDTINSRVSVQNYAWWLQQKSTYGGYNKKQALDHGFLVQLQLVCCC